MAARRLDGLPAELLDEIASYLPYTSALALAYTNRNIYEKLDKSVIAWTASSHLDIIVDLLILEQWPTFKRFLACCYCCKLLPKSHFTLRQIHRHEKEKYNIKQMLKVQRALKKRREAGKSSVCITKTRRPLVSNQNDLSMEMAGRLCIACGVREKRYSAGEELHFPIELDPDAPANGFTYGSGIVCKLCGLFKVCDPSSRAGRLRECWDCIGPTPGFHDKMFEYMARTPSFTYENTFSQSIKQHTS